MRWRFEVLRRQDRNTVPQFRNVSRAYIISFNTFSVIGNNVFKASSWGCLSLGIMEGYLQYRRLQQDVPDEVSSQAQKDSTDQVEFEDQDVHNPRNWSPSYKAFCTSIIWLLVFVTGWASSADSTAHEIADKDFHVSAVAESLATSMYLFGVGACAIFTGPISETIGRLTTYLGTFLLYLIWIMATALSPNFAAQIIFRFLAGFFAAASMSIYGGSLADMFDVSDRALVWPVFALSPLLGKCQAVFAINTNCVI